VLSLDAIGSIRVPVVFAHGSHDRVCSPADVQEMARTIPSSQLLWVDGGSHNMMMERPADIARVALASALEPDDEAIAKATAAFREVLEKAERDRKPDAAAANRT
jgi:predicted alpha/beta-hydrolase family hydrolase